MSDETGRTPVPPHVDQSKQHVREGTFHVVNEIVFQPLHPDTGAPLLDERDIAVERKRFYILHTTSEM